MAAKVAPLHRSDKLPSHYGDKNKDKGKQNYRDQGEVVHDRIYVGGLSQHIFERDLFHFFSGFGAVRHVVIISEGGYRKGYGFVTFTCREAVRRLLEGGERENLILMGMRLNIGAARQKFRQNFSCNEQDQGWSRDEDNFSQADGPVTVRDVPSKPSPGSTDKVPADTFQPADTNQTPIDPLQEDPNIYPYDSSIQPPWYSQAQGNLPIYPYSVPSYPIYYPQYLGPEYPQVSAYPPAPIIFPTLGPDVTWYPNTYIDTPTSQDAITTFPSYPIAYSSSSDGTYHDPTLAPTNQQPNTGHLFPQSQQYPVLYHCGQPPMIHYTGETYQPVLDYQDIFAYQNCPDVSHVNTYPEYQNTVTCIEGNTSGFTEVPELVDSGYLDTMDGFQDTTSSYPDQSSSQNQTTATDKHQVDTPDSMFHSKSAGGLSNKANPKHKNTSQNSPSNSNQEQETFIQLKHADENRLDAVRNSAKDQHVRPGRYARVNPSPHKNFAPFPGNSSSRHLTFGPRPYYSGQGQSRGRGQIWGDYNGGRRGEGSNTGKYSQKKRQNKKEAAGTEKCLGEGADRKNGGLELQGNQPDILQGPLEKLEIK